MTEERGCWTPRCDGWGRSPFFPTLPQAWSQNNQLSSLGFESENLFHQTLSSLPAIHLWTGPAPRDPHWTGGAATSGGGAHPGATAVSQHHRGAQVQAGGHREGGGSNSGQDTGNRRVGGESADTTVLRHALCLNSLDALGETRGW